MNFSTHTCTLTPSLCCTLLACMTGPSQNGADINRPGRSHVSVYTGRPQSSTTRVAGFPLHCKLTHFSSLFCTEKLRYASRGHAHACIAAEMQSIPLMMKIPKARSTAAWLFLLSQSYLVRFTCVTQPFLLHLSFFSLAPGTDQSPTFYADCYIFSHLTAFPQTHQTCAEPSFTTRPPRLSKALTLPSEFLWNELCDVRPT